MHPQQFIPHIRNLIAKNDLSTALAQLRLLLANSPQLDEAILQTARFQDIRRQIRLGMVSHTEATLTKNQIRAGLIDFLREMEEQEKVPAIKEEMAQAVSIVNSKNVLIGSTISAGGNVVIGDTTHTESKTSRRLRVLLFVVVPLLAIAGAYFWYQYQEMRRPLSLKVRIENQTPNAELPGPSGTLSLTYGQKTEAQSEVGDEAFFEGIPAVIAKEAEPVRLTYEPIGFVPVDTTLVIQRDRIVVIPVRRNDDLAILEGVMKDEAGRLLEGVKVSIAGCCSTLTDAMGAFLLKIPFAHQRTQQRLDLSKEEFVPESLSTPVLKGEMVRVALGRE